MRRSTRPSTPTGGSPPADMSTAPPGLAATGTISHCLNLVALNVFPRRAVIFAILSSRLASGIMSTLFITTSNSLVVISPTTRHSAVCVWMPLFTSTTSIMTSMICAPPRTVLIRLAWPGQSTSVNWISSYGRCFRFSGTGAVKEEKPRSSVMPRSVLWGCLSSDAVEKCVDNARARLVLPLSMWPRMPTLTFSTRLSPISAVERGVAMATADASRNFSGPAEDFRAPVFAAR